MAGEALSAEVRANCVDPVLRGMLMPSVFTMSTAEAWLREAGFRVVKTADFTEETLPTWDDGLKITQLGPVVKLAMSIGYDAIGLVEAIRGIRKAMAQGHMRYGVIVAEVP